MLRRSVGFAASLAVSLLAGPSWAADAPRECPAPPHFTTGVPDDPYFHGRGAWGLELPDQWGLIEVDAYPIAAVDETGPPVVVAVIDTGIDFEHPDLGSERLWRNTAEEINGRDDDGNGYVDDLVGWNFADGNNVPWDDSGHGTHVAGIIGAATGNGLGIAAVNPVAVLMPLKVANFDGHADGAALAAAIHYAVTMKADIINLSLGGPRLSHAEQTALDRARAAGVLVVTAAGNTAEAAGGFGYAGAPGVFTVVATAPGGERATFSNYGPRVDVAAPGVDILSLRARGSDFLRWTEPAGYTPGAAVVGPAGEYYRASGTSFAAAFVSGVASRVLVERRHLKAPELERVISQSAVDVGPPGVDQATGYGLVNLEAALAQPADQYVEARLTGAEASYRDGHVLLSILGRADAGAFRTAKLEYAPVGAPDDWRALGAPLTGPVSDGVVLETDLEALLAASGGTPGWHLRLVVTDQTGESREARLDLGLPVPEATSAVPDAEPTDA